MYVGKNTFFQYECAALRAVREYWRQKKIPERLASLSGIFSARSPLSKNGAAIFRQPHPHSAESMGTTCFFRLMTPGRYASLS